MMAAPISCKSSGVRVFTVPYVPTGMNTGVSITPRAVMHLPQARPGRAGGFDETKREVLSHAVAWSREKNCLIVATVFSVKLPEAAVGSSKYDF